MYLYKYRNFNDLALKMLNNNKYYFASPRDFNDPLDCSIEPIYDIPPIEKVIEYQAYVLKDTYGYSYEEALKLSQLLKHLSQSELKKFFKRIRDSIKNILENEYGILSLSEKNDHILMWSHYADYHKGFCIEFERTLKNPLAAAIPVKYFEDYPNFSYFDDLPGNIAKRIISSKASVWSYEVEWRAIQKSCAEVSYSDDMITGIILGLRIPTDHKKQIRQILDSKKHIKYYQAELMERKFKLSINLIN